jgi:ornithine carbamoyltransferase
MKDLVRISDLTAGDLELLLNLEAEFKAAPMLHREALTGELVVLLFDEPSTRTRLQFEQAAARLGAHPVAVNRDQLQLSRGEWIKDTARTFSDLARVLVVRCVDHGQIEDYAAECSASVVNGLTDLHHPTQVLADLAVLRARFGQLEGLKLAYVGDGTNVCHSLLQAGALAGMDVSVATPPEYFEPHPSIVGRAHDLARIGGGRIEIGFDPHAAVKGADVVYTDRWISIEDIESQHEPRRAVFASYRVDAALMAEATADAVFMHALPARRGDEVTGEVFDGRQSLVHDQLTHGTPMAQAVMLALTRGSLRGR